MACGSCGGRARRGVTVTAGDIAAAEASPGPALFRVAGATLSDDEQAELDGADPTFSTYAAASQFKASHGGVVRRAK